MRSSVLISDPGFRRNCFGSVITLDGERVRDCQTADEELGEVICLVRDDAGRKLILDTPHRHLATVVRRGLVTITLPPGQKKPKRAIFVRMFKPRFALPVEGLTKLQTVRPRPKRMPKAGDVISLRTWTGKPYRSKQRILRTALITKVEPIIITADAISIASVGITDADAFARLDGFANFAELRDWFLAEHGLPFSGIVITWQ